MVILDTFYFAQALVDILNFLKSKILIFEYFHTKWLAEKWAWQGYQCLRYP